jgi:hypothetical protein
VTYVLPWSVFPTSFKHDVDLFLERLSGKDLSEDGPPRPARPSTLQKRAYQLRLAASALIHRGHKADTVRSIADLLLLERYQEILRFFLDRHGGKTSQQVADMAAFLKDVARHWIKIDSSILEKMKKNQRLLVDQPRRMRDQNACATGDSVARRTGWATAHISECASTSALGNEQTLGQTYRQCTVGLFARIAND